MKVKEAIDVLWQSADYIEVVKVKHYLGGECRKETLYMYWGEDPYAETDQEEKIFDENYAKKEVLSINALGKGCIQIRIY